jgi:hypothetical protein
MKQTLRLVTAESRRYAHHVSVPRNRITDCMGTLPRHPWPSREMLVASGPNMAAADRKWRCRESRLNADLYVQVGN